MARSQGMSVAEWVRQALHLACRKEPRGDVGKKIAIIRVAAQHDYPVKEIDGMLAEIESGYSGGRAPQYGRRTVKK